MRYLIYTTSSGNKEIDVWRESQITHGKYADFHRINLSDISSGGYIYYDEKDNRFFLDCTQSWKDVNQSVVEDEEMVYMYIEKYLQNDVEQKRWLAQEWNKLQIQNRKILEQNPMLEKLIAERVRN